MIKALKIGSKDLPKLSLIYGTAPTKYGSCLAAFHGNVLCYFAFYDTEPPFDNLKRNWGAATLAEDAPLVSRKVTELFASDDNIEVYLKGTDFQVAVWEALLAIKRGSTLSYADVARAVGRPKAVRAVGTAVGKNHVGYFVPCHRVIAKDGSLGNYGAGPRRKLRILRDEGAM